MALKDCVSGFLKCSVLEGTYGLLNDESKP